MRGTLMAVVCVLVLSGCSGGDREGPAASAPRGAAPDDVQETWWSWSQSAPAAQDPVADTDGSHCDVGQPDDAWLLAGTYGGRAERSCAVPSGRPLVAPAVNLVSPGRAGCETFLDSARGEVLVDGEAVTLEELGPEPITIEGRDGESNGFACGLWAVLPPLGAGDHRVQITGRSGGFETRVDYRLTVS